MERIQKIMAHAGVASRRAAEELIKKGKVTVNGRRATLGDKATMEDNIEVNGKAINYKEEKVYYIINKPSKVITSVKDPQGRTVVTDLINEKKRIYPVGRLDYDTTGALILTNDGELAHRLTHPSFEVKRVYRARITRTLTDDELAFLNGDSVIINEKPSKQTITKVDNKSYIVVLNVGTYHHVKKLFELVDTDVLSLTRVEFAGITTVGMAKGEFRRLNIKEIRWLKQLTKII